MANSHKRCKQCGDYTSIMEGKQFRTGFFCKVQHAIDFANEKVLKNKKKAFKKETVRLKKTVKTRAKWLTELQAIVNKYVRLRDSKYGCICCDIGPNWDGQFQAGHFYPQGRSSALRFNVWNIHKQASSCNNHLSGNLLEYKPRLIDKIGQARFDYLEAHQNDIKSYDIEWIERAIKVAKKVLKRELKKH